MEQKDRRIAIIPARGGSKRIPKKNIKDFAGKPIIAYPIETALKSNLFDEVMVSTDDEEIAALAKSFGANVPFYRSKTASDDHATTIDVLLEVISEYSKLGSEYEYVCCIYPCAPFISSQHLEKAYTLMFNNKAETIFPVIKYSHPIQRALRKQGDFVSMIDENNLTVRTQDLPARFHDAGQFYWLNKDALLKNKKLITGNTLGLEISESEVHDIDNIEDWKIAEIKYGVLHGNN